jgi:hypothetical protein
LYLHVSKVWVFSVGGGDEVVTKFLQHVCVQDMPPEKHSEKMLLLEIMSLRQSIRGFVWVLFCFICYTEVGLYILVNIRLCKVMEQNP